MKINQTEYIVNSQASNEYEILIPPKLNLRTTRRMINFDKVISLCDENAKTPFLIWHQIPRKNLPYFSPIELSSLINGNSSLDLIHDKRGTFEQFYFFNSFNLISLLDSKKITVNLIKKEDLDTHIIELYSWFEVIKLLVNAHIDDDIGYPIFKTLINQHMPKNVKKYFFNTNNLSTVQLCKLANLTKRQFSHQQIKLKKLIKPASNKVLSFSNILLEARS